jgi:hypothetical protein
VQGLRERPSAGAAVGLGEPGDGVVEFPHEPTHALEQAVNDARVKGRSVGKTGP